MLRILHTADWHIGQTLCGYSREEEHRAVLAHIVALCKEHAVDALIVAGDIFDTQNPSGEAQQLYYDTLLQLKAVQPQMQMVITAGNHDAAGRLEAPNRLLKSFNIHVVGSIQRQNGSVNAQRHLVPLHDKDGNLAAHVLAVSYPTAACLPPFARQESEGTSPVFTAVRQLYAELMEQTRPHTTGLPLIVTGHLHVAGGIESEGAERRILVGGDHAVPPDVFPPDATYVGLGHLHKAQGFAGTPVFYSGSLIPLRASEQAYKHSVNLLTFNGMELHTERLYLPRVVPFLRIPERDDLPFEHWKQALQDLALAPDIAPAQRPFIHVQFARENLPAGFREEAERIAAEFPVRVVDIKVTPLTRTLEQAAQPDTLIRLAERQPEELFAQAFEKTHGTAPQEKHRTIFHHILSDL